MPPLSPTECSYEAWTECMEQLFEDSKRKQDKILNIISHQGNASQNHNDMPRHAL